MQRKINTERQLSQTQNTIQNNLNLFCGNEEEKMSSVMEIIRFRDKLQGLPIPVRNQVITEMIAWLESTERPKCKSEHLSHLIHFENELQNFLNKQIPEGWFTKSAQTYGSFPFYDGFIRKIL